MNIEEIRESLKKAETKVVELMKSYRKSLPNDIFIGKIELKRVGKEWTCFNGNLARNGELTISLIEFYKQVEDSLLNTRTVSSASDVKWINGIRGQVTKDFVPDFLSILINLEAETGLYIDAFNLNNAGMGENMITLALIERKEM